MHFKNLPIFIRPRFFIPSRIALVTFALGATAISAAPPAHAADEVAVSAQAGTGSNSYRLFYDKLANDGDWFQTDQYGYVFQPRTAAQNRDWRPYTDGYWAQTDSGWTWVSNEEFGWATYHYGRWANVEGTGWVWVPGNEWSPAYVSWRVSKDHKHVGWAPLPPEARLSKGQNVEGWVDSAYDIGPSAYVFIDTTHFGETSYRSHLLPVEQNTTFITETDNVTRLDYRTVDNRSVIYDGGPDVTVIREATGRPVRELHLETRAEGVDFFEHGDNRRITAVNGDRLVVATAAPEVITSTSIRVSEPAHVGRRLTNFNVDRGYRGIGDAQAIERYRTHLRTQSPPTPPQVEREASTALHRDGAQIPTERNVGNRNEASPVPSRDAQHPGTEPSPADVRNGHPPQPEASPTAADRRGPAQTPPGATPENGRIGRQRPEASPTASPEASPANRTKASEASPTPGRTSEQGARAGGRSEKPESTATPGTPATSEEHLPPAHSRQPSTPSREETPTPTKARETRAAEQEAVPNVTPRHGAETNESGRIKPEATPRASSEEPARRAEKSSTGETEEKKPATTNAETGAARRAPGESRNEERTPGNNSKERAEKKEGSETSGEKTKPSPKP